MEIEILHEIVIIFALAVAVAFACYRFKIPAVVGFLLTGTLAGPHGLGLIGAVHEVEMLAEIGVVLLLFTIGMEFSIGSLMAIKKLVLVGGAVQGGVTTAVCAGITYLMGFPVNTAVFIGFLMALSSTAIVLKLLQERAEIESPHGRAVLAVLIFQDIAVVPMMLVVPFLAGTGGEAGASLLILLAKAAGVILLVIASARWIVPQLLYQVARTRFREVFLLSIIVICLAVAWLTAEAGLSLALGAFMAGLIISESEYSHQAIGNIMPLRDVFTSFFFVSIGMLLNVDLLIQKPLVVLAITIGIVIIKALVAGLAALVLGFPVRTTVMVGLALAQVGEFSFILALTGIEYNLLPEAIYQMFLACSVLTMALSPFMIAFSARMADLALRLPLPERFKAGATPWRGTGTGHEGHHHHLVIVGYGVNGQNMARAADMAKIPYTIIEMNPETVRREREKGVSIHYGDATQEAVLEFVGIETAKVAVIAINDNTATRRVTEAVRRLSPRAHLIVRTRFFSEMGPLYALGANEVIPEEFETSVEIFSRVLGKYLIPREDIERFVAEVRSDGYRMFRSLSRESSILPEMAFDFPDVEINSFRVSTGAPMDGTTLAAADLRKKYGITILAIRRNGSLEPNPDGDAEVRAGDLLFVLGSPDRIAKAVRMFK